MRSSHVLLVILFLSFAELIQVAQQWGEAKFSFTESGQTAPVEPVIDVHLHAMSDELLPLGPHRYHDVVGSAQTQEEVVRGTVAQMAKHNVVLGLVHDAPESMELLRKELSDRIWLYPAPGVKHPIDLDELDRKLESGEWRGIGEISTQYNGLKPTDAMLWPYYEIANLHQVPVFWHTGMSFPGITRSQPLFRADHGQPIHWEDIFVRYPDLRAVLVHAGYPFLDEMIAILNLYPATYVDTGAIVHLFPPKEFYRYIGTLIDAGFGDRILFGSDQMGWPESIGYSIEVIQNGPWDEKIKRDILYDNAARFLSLSQETIDKHHGR